MRQTARLELNQIIVEYCCIHIRLSILFSVWLKFYFFKTCKFSLVYLFAILKNQSVSYV